MGLRDWLWASRARRKPAVDPRIAQCIEQEEAIRAYLRERDVPYELDRAEVPYAVITPTRSTDQEESLRKLGEILLAWQASNSAVTRILGLDRLLEGKCPEVSAHLLMIPICPTQPVTWIEPVALVVVDHSTAREDLAASLCEVVERNGAARVWSWEQYNYLNR